MKRIAMFLYKKACILNLPLFRGDTVESDLAALHPGERVECIKADYYVKKLSKCLMLLAAGLIMGLFAKLQQLQNTPLGKEGVIYRGKYAEGEKQLLLEADNGDEKQEFHMTVSAQNLTDAELQEFADDFLANLSELILNGNSDIEHITDELELTDAYEGYPFEVEWDSDREEIVDNNGRVCEVEEPEKVTLSVTMNCQQYSKTESFSVMVVPRSYSPEEREYREINEYLVNSERESRDEEEWVLPEEWNDRPLVWRLKEKKYCLLIWAFTPVVCLLLYYSFDRDMHREVEQRQREMKRQYPELVHKLALYIGAGMTIRGAFQRIGADYERKTNRQRDGDVMGREVLYTCRELQSGIAEGAAYERFGRRIGLREYIKLSALLDQNLKRGNRTLLERLREEAEKSCEESVRNARKLGEESGTKLLIPMVAMLAIVMVMIMIPAFGTI